ncbi:MAG: hypothetical protein DRP82_01890 [Planctomycetota bacterium]|nr:MAG: hypothetical protein DRP82_01890 [Planctomycetota bacterium]
MKVCVIGGGGRIGLPMCLVLAEAGHTVYGLDINEENNQLIMSGRMPFYEEQGEEYLKRALSAGRLFMTSDISCVKSSDVIMITIGTPPDEHLRPVMTPLTNLIKQLCPLLQTGQLVILRSTVPPGTTDRVKTLIEERTKLKIGREIFLVFAPERAVQGQAIKEIRTLPQIIGAYDENSYERAKDFFLTFLRSDCIRLTPLEAEIGKLLTNLTRYVLFALANECYLIAESFGVNINKIIDAYSKDYPRFGLPVPGPNVGGPCLYKDGWFLIESIPYNELYSVAFRINEGMPTQIAKKIQQHPGIRKVAILGMTYKANSDDPRYSLSFRLKKQLRDLGYEVVTVDPHLSGCAPLSAIEGSDAVVLMTPHDEFKNLRRIMDFVRNRDCLYVDIWGAWSEMRHRSKAGYFYGKDVPDADSGGG